MPQTRSETLAVIAPVSTPRSAQRHRLNPYAKASAQVNKNLKPSTVEVVLPSPPRTVRKRRHVDSDPQLDDNDVPQTPTKVVHASNKVVTVEITTTKTTTVTEHQTPRRGRSAVNTSTPLTSLRVVGGKRSRSPVSADVEQTPTSTRFKRLSGAARQLAKDNQNEATTSPPRKKARRAAVTLPQSPTRQTRSSGRTSPIKDSASNPFLSSVRSSRKKSFATEAVPLHKRETIQMV